MNIKKLLTASVVGMFALALVTGAAFAVKDVTLNWGTEVNPGKCAVSGPPIINVTHKVLNGVDSAVGGGVWASADYNRHIQIWQVDEDSFCAVVSYRGNFTTDDGKSPSGVPDALDEGIKGSFEGGYRAHFDGSLESDPEEKTKGNLGTFDYNCDVETDPGDHSSCAGLFSWPSTYIDGISNFTYDWWGWIYHAGKYGTWVNASSGNLGDITSL